MAAHIQKKAEEEMSSLEAENELIPADPSQEEEERSRMTTNSINYFNTLRSREICVTGKYSGKVPNIFRDYHLEAYCAPDYINAPYFVIADEIIFVIFDSFEIYPLRRNGEFSPISYKDKDGLKKIKFDIDMIIQSAYYNSNNNSLILVATDVELPSTVIVSLQIEPIKAGLRTEHTNICPQDGNMIGAWDFDIPNCRGMVYNMQERLFKVFELKKYTPLFTILPTEGDDSFLSDFRFGSPGNMEFFGMMYPKDSAREEVSYLRIYSKHTGQLRKRISVPVYPHYSIDHMELCGTDRFLLQQSHLGMQILDISAETCRVIKTITEMVGRPCYLWKRNLFICCTERRGVTGLHVYNLQGEIVFTFQDHQILEPNLLFGSHIPSAEDIVISICHDRDAFKIKISSILTGECIGRITAEPSDSNELREIALESLVTGSFAYNETTHEIFTGTQLGEIFIWSNKVYDDVDLLNLDSQEMIDNINLDTIFMLLS